MKKYLSHSHDLAATDDLVFTLLETFYIKSSHQICGYFAFKSFTPPERKIMKTLKTLLTAATLMAMAPIAFSASHASAPMGMPMDHSKMNMPMAGSAAKMNAVEMTDGEIRKVDMDNKKLTIKHGNIKNLDMPGMTMVFQVKDPAML